MTTTKKYSGIFFGIAFLSLFIGVIYQYVNKPKENKLGETSPPKVIVIESNEKDIFVSDNKWEIYYLVEGAGEIEIDRPSTLNLNVKFKRKDGSWGKGPWIYQGDSPLYGEWKLTEVWFMSEKGSDKFEIKQTKTVEL